MFLYKDGVAMSCECLLRKWLGEHVADVVLSVDLDVLCPTIVFVGSH